MDTYKKFAHIYDELVNDDIDYKRWSLKILDVLKENNCSNEDYLDLACGTGNMTALIAPFFKNSYGSDLSEEMLCEADDKLRKAKVKVNFICQDMRDLSINRSFDLITCCLDSLNYILSPEDLKITFERVFNHLKENGIFIFDINSHYKLTSVIGDNTFSYVGDDVAYIWENSLENDIISMYLTFFVKNNEKYERFDEEHEERAYKEEIIEELLKQNNLEVVGKMDNYYSRSVRRNTERITFIVKKKR